MPRIGNDWGACDPAEPRNRRTRASLLIEHENTRLLVDTSPDMREQLLAADVSGLDAVIWTHDHADHCHGIDDLRQVYHAIGRPVRGLARSDTLTVLQSRFAYAFAGRAGYPATIIAEVLPQVLRIGEISVSTTDQPHASITSVGLCFEANSRRIGYATDFNSMTDDMLTLYEDLDIWIVDALRHAPHPSHPTVAAVLGWVELLKPKQAVLIHMDQSLDYSALRAALPPGVEPGYDGQVLE